MEIVSIQLKIHNEWENLLHKFIKEKISTILKINYLLPALQSHPFYRAISPILHAKMTEISA
ncbi:hypothetical protein HMPREF9944_00630 [Segatella maculosa OT 289]|uniref:Uncharacterized protein n=1 Tax=Segatella maculosa OT 289 TaxID=999422 RepID=H1HKD6_9BACT|nr:hypothetical protein HMPREF9944_00630 [Segatella maculosa OT 289]